MRIQVNRTNGGWTLIEIMIVVLLIGMLAGIAVPSLFKARDVTYMNTIQANLRLIDDVKEHWALEHRMGAETEPLDADLLPYLKGNSMPRPIVGETYSPNELGASASATIPISVGNLPAGSVITLY